MTHVIAKIGIAATAVAGALSAGLFYLSSTVDGLDAIFLYRMGVTAAIAGLLVGVVTWAVRRVDRLTLEFEVARKCAAAERAAGRCELKALKQENAKIQRAFNEFRDDVRCRLLMMELVEGGDPVLRAMFREEN